MPKKPSGDTHFTTEKNRRHTKISPHLLCRLYVYYSYVYRPEYHVIGLSEISSGIGNGLTVWPRWTLTQNIFIVKFWWRTRLGASMFPPPLCNCIGIAQLRNKYYDAVYTQPFPSYHDTLCIQVSLFLRRISTHFYSVTPCWCGIYYGPVSVRPSDCVCVCLLQVGVVLKRLEIGSQNHTIAQGVLFSGAKDLSEIPPWSPPTGAPIAGVVG